LSYKVQPVNTVHTGNHICTDSNIALGTYERQFYKGKPDSVCVTTTTLRRVANKQLAVGITSQHSILKVPGSNSDGDTGTLDWAFTWCASVLRGQNWEIGFT